MHSPSIPEARLSLARREELNELMKDFAARDGPHNLRLERITSGERLWIHTNAHLYGLDAVTGEEQGMEERTCSVIPHNARIKAMTLERIAGDDRRCDNCERKANYDLRLQYDTSCGYCDDILYHKGYTVRTCGKKCKGCYWTVEAWNVSRMQYFMEDSECSSCGQRNDPSGVFNLLSL